MDGDMGALNAEGTSLCLIWLSVSLIGAEGTGVRIGVAIGW